MIDILTHHRWQTFSSSCASACLSTVSDSIGLKLPSESKLHNALFNYYLDGTAPTDMEKLSFEQGSDVKLFKDLTLENAKSLIDENHVLISLITDYYPTIDDDPPEGHYAIMQNVDLSSELVTFIDPSKAKRFFTPGGVLSINKNGNPSIRPSYKVRFCDLAWQDLIEPHGIGHGYALAFKARNGV